MPQLDFTRAALRFGAVVMALIGAAHMVMPTYGYAPDVAPALTPQARAHFYYLAAYAIGGFLLALAALSAFAITFGIRERRVICAIMAALWLWRGVLEQIYPVDLRLFLLDDPHPVLLAAMVALTGAYGLAALAPTRPG